MRTCPAGGRKHLSGSSCAKLVSGQWSANPPKGLGPARIVQLEPMSGAGMLVTAAADGRHRRVPRENPVDVNSSTIERPDHKGLSVSGERVDAENASWDPIGTRKRRNTLGRWLLGSFYVLPEEIHSLLIVGNCGALTGARTTLGPESHISS